MSSSKGFIIIIIIFLIAIGHNVLGEGDDIGVSIDFENINFSHQPVIINNTTLVHLRPIFEKLDVDVIWEAPKITIFKDKLKIELWIDNDIAFVNGEEKKLAVSPKLINGATYVPIRFVSELLNANVYWENNTINIFTDTKESLLIKAIKNNDFSKVKTLLDNNVNPNNNYNDENPLETAIISGNEDIIYLLIQNKADTNSPNKEGKYPLEIAYKERNVDIIISLINSNANLNLFYSDNMSPLFLAIHYNLPEIVELLILKGANVNLKNSGGINAFELICIYKDREKIVSILENSNKLSAKLTKEKRFQDIEFNDDIKFTFEHYAVQDNKLYTLITIQNDTLNSLKINLSPLSNKVKVITRKKDIDFEFPEFEDCVTSNVVSYGDFSKVIPQLDWECVERNNKKSAEIKKYVEEYSGLHSDEWVIQSSYLELENGVLEDINVNFGEFVRFVTTTPINEGQDILTMEGNYKIDDIIVKKFKLDFKVDEPLGMDEYKLMYLFDY